ncbi:hypothetical protein N7508_002214 [Penicillium antarcticum]|uniref:uncharacterized protein n=1 Tax=Penicillium antarcticum TaxID=416450 RepID=UPI0023983562|nr:uncharacterized protein N7508_002214 [Penicillium antarcticum]KAJ5317706.1 hypothetical protein N7508_002214 [Penicillium antarcticum]
MGLISTLSRHMRNKRLSRRLSSQSSKLQDDDSNDLIKPYSETASLRAESVASTSTMVHHSLHEPVLPSESPANRMTIRTDNLNMRTLFDTSSHTTPISPTSISPMDNRPVRALSRPEYPVLKLDMCQAPFEPRKLAEPLETGPRRAHDTRKIGKSRGRECSSESSTDAEKDVDVVSPGKSGNVNVKEKKRRSMKGLLKKHCGLDIPRSSLSLKTRKSPASASTRWLDSAGAGEDGDEGFVDVKDEKWLEAHLGLRGRRRNAIWGGSALGRPL